MHYNYLSAHALVGQLLYHVRQVRWWGFDGFVKEFLKITSTCNPTNNIRSLRYRYAISVTKH